MSDDCCTTSIYYDPPPAVTAPFEADSAWLLVLFLAGLLAIALIALLPKTDKPPKSLTTAREEINKAVGELSANANRLNRPEVTASVQELATRVENALKDVKKIT